MYNYRICLKKDLIKIIELTNKWKDEGITLGYENVCWTEESLELKLNDYFYVVELDESIIGYSFGEIRRGNAEPVIKQVEAYLEIHEVYIIPEYRAMGLGKELIKRLLNKAQVNDVERALVGSSNKNWRDTARFYEDLGFNMWYIQMYK